MPGADQVELAVAVDVARQELRSIDGPVEVGVAGR